MKERKQNMEIIKKVRPILTESELRALDTACDILETICETCSGMSCEDTCPFSHICARIHFPPHNVLMDITDILSPTIEPDEEE
jgi:hypothetical protein